MERRGIAIACRGGGSRCAFVAGLLEEARDSRTPIGDRIIETQQGHGIQAH